MNYDTFIKQEFLTTEEQLIQSTPDNDLNIFVKNEPILDESISFVTIKNEPLTEATCFIEGVPIKTENYLQNQETVPWSKNGCLIYEMELPATSSSSMMLNCETSLNSNFEQKNVSNSLIESTTRTANSHPVLLNAQLRKRHKVILPLQPVDKRKRYNIEGASSKIFEKINNATISSGIAKTCRLLNPGRKKYINHLIKQKPTDSEENCYLPKSSATNTKHQNANQIEQQRMTNSTAQSQQSPNSPIMPELRVKCLCSLTHDSLSNNSDLRKFFKKMFEETRLLEKTQQRKVKMTLLKAICDAEDLVEQGKCCGF